MQLKQFKNSYDIIVTGAGIAGISAASKAASMGASVLLVEHYGFVGGMSAAGMVSPFMKSRTGNIDLVKGVFESLENGMQELGGMIDNGFYAWAFRSVANNILKQHQVDLALNTDLVEAVTEGTKIVSVKLASSYGIQTVSAKYFIDTSGDAQLVLMAGLPYAKGDENTGKLQAVTLFFRMGGINVEKTAQYAKNNPTDFLPWMDFKFDFSKIISIAGYKSLIEKAKKENRLPQEIEYVFFTTLAGTGEGSFNCTNILGIDPSYSDQLTKAEQIGHYQVAKITDFLITDVPGFEHAFLIDTGVQIGVRETRRIIAEYMMTGNDVLNGARFNDVIGRACYGIDIHGQNGEKSRMEDLEEGSWYEIPLRSLLVKNIENVMGAGRCIGATREGHSALRIMPTSAATGEACGVVTALAAKLNIPIRMVPYNLIRKHLIHNIEN